MPSVVRRPLSASALLIGHKARRGSSIERISNTKYLIMQSRMQSRMLTKTENAKDHGKNLMETPALDVLWGKKENEGKNIESGAFASLLRYGSVHIEQLREDVDYLAAEKPEYAIPKGLVEA